MKSQKMTFQRPLSIFRINHVRVMSTSVRYHMAQLFTLQEKFQRQTSAAALKPVETRGMSWNFYNDHHHFKYRFTLLGEKGKRTF